MDETTEQAARRELQEETSVDSSEVPLLFVGVYDKPDRDPRGRVISAAYFAEIPDMTRLEAKDDAKEAEWFDVFALPNLAFDHQQIINKAIGAVAEKI